MTERTPSPPSEQPSSPPPEPQRSLLVGAQARGGTLVITNLTKLAGVGVVVNETMIRSNLRPSALAVASLMMLGAQVSEDMILKAIDRFFGRTS